MSAKRGVRLAVRVRPGARRTAVVSYDGSVARIDVAAPAAENRANAALIAFLADQLGIGISRIQIIRGATGRQKLLEIEVPPATIGTWLAGFTPRGTVS